MPPKGYPANWKTRTDRRTAILPIASNVTYAEPAINQNVLHEDSS
jgi:hypothetical protein